MTALAFAGDFHLAGQGQYDFDVRARRLDRDDVALGHAEDVDAVVLVQARAWPRSER